MFTELAGFTEDGDLVLKQPYVFDLHVIPDDEAAQALRSRGFTLPRNMEDMAVAMIDGVPHLFTDLHGNNVMRTSRNDVFLIDATCRPLSASELTLLKLG